MRAFRSEYDNIIEALEFYQLQIGDKFRVKKVIYEKITDDLGKFSETKAKFFWPQDTVWLLEKIRRDEVHVRYPLTSYIH